jgi:hypothetical protein
MTMSDIDKGPTYSSGEYPKVGDLIGFGTQHKRMRVTEIDEDNPNFSMYCGIYRYGFLGLKLMVLIARHGEPETNNKGLNKMARKKVWNVTEISVEDTVAEFGPFDSLDEAIKAVAVCKLPWSGDFLRKVEITSSIVGD